jgi:hypothetical protein
MATVATATLINTCIFILAFLFTRANLAKSGKGIIV